MKVPFTSPGGLSPRKKILVALVIAVLALLVGLLIGVSGQTTKKAANTTKSAPSSNADAGINYFVIKEWGVKAPYSGSLHFTYTLSSEDDNPQLNYATLTSKELAGADPSCQDRGGAIERYAPNDAVFPANLPARIYFASQPKASYVLVDGYYYAPVDPLIDCSTSDAANTLQKQNNADVRSIVRALQPITAK